MALHPLRTSEQDQGANLDSTMHQVQGALLPEWMPDWTTCLVLTVHSRHHHCSQFPDSTQSSTHPTSDCSFCCLKRVPINSQVRGVSPLLRTLHGSQFTQRKSQSSPQPLLYTIPSMPSSLLIPSLPYCTPATPASWLFFKAVPTSGPLHIQWALPGTFLPWHR